MSPNNNQVILSVTTFSVKLTPFLSVDFSTTVEKPWNNYEPKPSLLFVMFKIYLQLITWSRLFSWFLSDRTVTIGTCRPVLKRWIIISFRTSCTVHRPPGAKPLLFKHTHTWTSALVPQCLDANQKFLESRTPCSTVSGSYSRTVVTFCIKIFVLYRFTFRVFVVLVSAGSRIKLYVIFRFFFLPYYYFFSYWKKIIKCNWVKEKQLIDYWITKTVNNWGSQLQYTVCVKYKHSPSVCVL